MFVIRIRGPGLPWNVAFLHKAIPERKSISSGPPRPSSQAKGNLFVSEGQKAGIKRQTMERRGGTRKGGALFQRDKGLPQDREEIHGTQEKGSLIKVKERPHVRKRCLMYLSMLIR